MKRPADQLTPDQLYELQERAAILEYDAGMDRDEAWKRAARHQEEFSLYPSFDKPPFDSPELSR